MNRDELKAVMGWMARDRAFVFGITSMICAFLVLNTVLLLTQWQAAGSEGSAPVAGFLLTGLGALVVGVAVGLADRSRVGMSVRLPISWKSHLLAGASWLGILSLPSFLILAFAIWRAPDTGPLFFAVAALAWMLVAAFSSASHEGGERGFHLFVWIFFGYFWWRSLPELPTGPDLMWRHGLAVGAACLIGTAASYLRSAEGKDRDNHYGFLLGILWLVTICFVDLEAWPLSRWRNIYGLFLGYYVFQSLRILGTWQHAPWFRPVLWLGDLAGRGFKFALGFAMDKLFWIYNAFFWMAMLAIGFEHFSEAVRGNTTAHSAESSSPFLLMIQFGWLLVMIGSWVWAEGYRMMIAGSWHRERPLSSRLPVSRETWARELKIKSLKPLRQVTPIILTVSLPWFFFGDLRWPGYLGLANLCVLTIFLSFVTVSCGHGRGYVGQFFLALGATFGFLAVGALAVSFLIIGMAAIQGQVLPSAPWIFLVLILSLEAGFSLPILWTQPYARTLDPK